METGGNFHPRIDPGADVPNAAPDDDAAMTFTDYLIDSALVLLVLLQIKERKLTAKAIIRPMVIVAIAVANYLHGIPTAGNDLVLIVVLALVGLLIGVASGQAVIMRRGGDGDVLARAGWISAHLLGAGDGLAVRFPDLGQQRWLVHDRPLQRHAFDHRRRGVDGGAAGDGGVRGVRAFSDPRGSPRAPDGPVTPGSSDRDG